MEKTVSRRIRARTMVPIRERDVTQFNWHPTWFITPRVTRQIMKYLKSQHDVTSTIYMNVVVANVFQKWRGNRRRICHGWVKGYSSLWKRSFTDIIRKTIAMCDMFCRCWISRGAFVAITETTSNDCFCFAVPEKVTDWSYMRWWLIL